METFIPKEQADLNQGWRIKGRGITAQRGLLETLGCFQAAVSSTLHQLGMGVLNQSKHHTSSSARTRPGVHGRAVPVQDQELYPGITKILRALETGRDLPAGSVGLEILVNTRVSQFSA